MIHVNQYYTRYVIGIFLSRKTMEIAPWMSDIADWHKRVLILNGRLYCSCCIWSLPHDFRNWSNSSLHFLLSSYHAVFLRIWVPDLSACLPLLRSMATASQQVGLMSLAFISRVRMPLVLKMWSSWRTGASDKLSINHFFWYSVFIHSAHITKPSQLPQAKVGEHAAWTFRLC